MYHCQYAMTAYTTSAMCMYVCMKYNATIIIAYCPELSSIDQISRGQSKWLESGIDNHNESVDTINCIASSMYACYTWTQRQRALSGVIYG